MLETRLPARTPLRSRATLQRLQQQGQRFGAVGLHGQIDAEAPQTIPVLVGVQVDLGDPRLACWLALLRNPGNIRIQQEHHVGGSQRLTVIPEPGVMGQRDVERTALVVDRHAQQFRQRDQWRDTLRMLAGDAANRQRRLGVGEPVGEFLQRGRIGSRRDERTEA